MTSTPAPPDTIVLIHGLWMTSRSWEGWAQRYRDRGFTVIDESWPGMDADVDVLRRDPAPIAGLTITSIVDHYASVISALERPPIIIGHSFGGTFTQVLLDRGLGAAGVAVASAAVKGVNRLPFSTLRTGWPILKNPANRHRAVSISARQFVAGSIDHVSPPSLVKSNVKKYRRSTAITEYQEYEGRSHLTIAQDGWEAVADGVLDWALSHATAGAPSWS